MDKLFVNVHNMFVNVTICVPYKKTCFGELNQILPQAISEALMHSY